MSRSSRREPPRSRRGRPATRTAARRSGRLRSRAQTEPLAALVALFAVCAGVSLYAAVLGGSIPDTGRDLSDPALERIRDAASDAGAVRPRALSAAVDAGPDGRRVNATLSAGDRRWSVGPTPPPRADRASRPVSVRLAPGRVTPGRLAVAVWR